MTTNNSRLFRLLRLLLGKHARFVFRSQARLEHIKVDMARMPGHQLGYLYVLVPAALGALVMLVIALLVNNIPKTRKYPEFWF